MASACVNNIGVSPETFTATYPSYGWLSPRLSFSRELPSEKPAAEDSAAVNDDDNNNNDNSSEEPPPPALDPADFEFRLEDRDPVAMLPADKLFSDGKLVPLHLSSLKPYSSPDDASVNDQDSSEPRRRTEIAGGSDPYLFSPKAPRCSSRWRELFRLKRLYNTSNGSSTKAERESHKTSSFSCSSSSSSSSVKLFLHRSSKWSSSSSSSALSSSSDSLPLLKDSDCESVSLSSSRLSLSSSSSGGHEHDDLPRHSLDSDKPSSAIPISLHRNPNNPPPPRMRVVKQRSSVDHPQAARAGRSPIRRPTGESSGSTSRGVSVDSPRMNSSGKIVFQSLERSSSSPSSFNGGPRFKHRGMERSYSANVRITPVLNVPVCSLRVSSKSGSVFGFGQLFSSPQKRSEVNNNGSAVGRIRVHDGHGRNRTERN